MASAVAQDITTQLPLEGEVVLLDIEGTISPISFVRDVLFPYAREHLSAFIDAHGDDPVVIDILARASDFAAGEDPIVALERWQDRDEKIPPLKKLQGLIWEAGFRSGAFRSHLFPDALDALERWTSAGLRLYVYSSGSIQAQDLFFAHNAAGDLRPLFFGHFDTDIGSKVERASYMRVAERIGEPPDRIVFFSDNAKELEAARSAGFQVVHVIKDGTRPSPDLMQITNFDQVDITRPST